MRMIVLFAALLTAGAAAAAEKSPIGRKAENFTLKDYRGKEHSLADYQDKKLVVLAFLGVECPLAKQYAPRLATLSEKYGPKGVAFLGVNSNSQDALTAIAASARIHKIEFPVLKDLENKVADAVGAVRTPEVFVLDRERIIRYRGRIDDQFGVGYARDKPTRTDLETALEELLAGKPVSKPETPVAGCFIGRVSTVKSEGKITFSNQVVRIFQERCVECHRKGDIAPFSLTSFKESAGWAATIAEVIEEGRMPPWHASPKHGKFRNDRRLTDEEKKTILQWVADSAPEGDPKRMPAPKTFVEGWQLPRKPDLVVDMAKTPYKVPAEGVVRYQYFTADPGLKEDRWIEAAEILPGNRAVVHHILVFAMPPGGRGAGALLNEGGRGYLVGYVPGKRVMSYDAGMAKRIPAGSRLLFQVHYTPNGTAQEDVSKIGFLFADPKKIEYEVKTVPCANPLLSIPPGAGNHKVEATTRQSLGEGILLGFAPHMHVRGKSFEYEAVYPDGKKEMLLEVPRYDFNWQTTYRLTEPKKVPAGTKMHCVAHYDNSEKNLNNPDPTSRVRWGDQTWNEMMIGYFDIAYPMKERKN